MSIYGVSKFLFAFNREAAVRSAFRERPEAVLADYPLHEEERQALMQFNFRHLYDRGVHPLLLTALANGSGIPILEYFESIRSGQPVTAASGRS